MKSLNFSAVILAGGQSRRMGMDKAFLDWHGLPLLARQIETVLALHPDELFISGRVGVDYGRYDYPILHDSFPDSGPVGGIERALQVTRNPLLLVLAVDMPCMSAKELAQLETKCTAQCGVVPVAAGRIQPLAAFYPKAAHRIALEMLGSGCAPAREFAKLCQVTGLVEMQAVATRDAACFANCNTPGNLPRKMKNMCRKSIL